ncbi:insulinase family protein [Protaetiibacter intestinalis]|uniref:Insulinase family protein n=1 Tax=Protaetiibacter intestinalis TaxID=2419774 RepID=A0A387B7Y4_9MICO|nr:insulinase family protein [Protaetiibacter intestinalis]AYF98467.1 insulinase family protein [Protaetiibacter intestinalis]
MSSTSTPSHIATAVDGIPTLHGARPGPLTAGLLFRVGRADEPLVAAGVTHLVEHLALHGRDVGALDHNGTTNDTFTAFQVTGSERAVVAYLNGLCAALRALPLERLEAEKDVLRTERAQGGGGAVDIQRTERYGAQGPGIVPYGEVGLGRIDAAAVSEWARTRFTRGNAVLWLTSDRIPAGLDMRLPDGPRIPVPEWQEAERPHPAYVVGAPGGVLLDAVLPRSAASSMFSRVAGRMLFRELREEAGLSYTAASDYQPIDGARAHVTLQADALPERHEAVTHGVIDVLLRLRAGDVEDRDLDAVRATVAEIAALAATDVGFLFTSAFDQLMGEPVEDPATFAAESLEIGATEIAEVAELFYADAIAQIPEGDLEWAGFTAAPRWSASAVDGEVFPVRGQPQYALKIGEEGASLHTPEGDVTVRYADCVGYLTLPDGARTLIGRDGFRVVIEPTQYADLDVSTLSTLDERLSDVTIPLPARPPEEIPVGASMRWSGYGPWAGVLGALLALMLTVAFPFALGLSDSVASGNHDGALIRLTAAGWTLVAVLAALATLLFVGVFRRRRATAAIDGP